MKSVIFSILLPVAILATGCAHAHPTVSSDWSRIEAYLATLHVGMTPKVAERELQQWDCVPVGTLSSVLSHRQSYIFLSDGSVVILQYDEHDRLISWEGKQGHGTPPNPQGGANGRQPFGSETNRTPAAAASRRSPWLFGATAPHPRRKVNNENNQIRNENRYSHELRSDL